MRFEGIFPALVTPLHEDESIQCDALAQLLEHLLQGGADGFYIAGATGEGLALRPQERRRLAEESIRIVNHRKPCPFLCIWKDEFNAAKFVCLEPWSSLPADGVTPENFNEREMRRLAPSATEEFFYTLSFKN